MPGWLTFLLGVAVGLFIAFLWYVKEQERAKTPVAGAPEAVKPGAPGAEPPQFDFYTILTEQEVVIPDQDSKEPVKIREAREVVKETPEPKPEPAKIETAKPETVKTEPAKAPAQTKPAATRSGGYVLQVGSFKKMEEADRLRASLALLGVESSVQVVRLGDGEQWHRVRVGPFEDMERAKQIRVRLTQNKIKSILLQVKS
jgi:cell division protein FtsN